MSTGRLVRIKIAFRTIKRALISCRSAEWKGCFGIFKRVDAYRRNVQLKRRCSGLESRERQLNRKITRPGEKPVRLSADKTNANLPRNLPRNQRNYRDRLSGGRVIVLFISFVFSLSLSLILQDETSSSFPSKEPKEHALFEFLLLSRLLSPRF